MKSSKNAGGRHRIALRRKSDDDPGLPGYYLRRCDQLFRHTISSLREASPHSQIKPPGIRPPRPKDLVYVSSVNSATHFLLGYYDRKISEAIKSNNAALAALLGIQVGNLVAELRLNVFIRRGVSVTTAGGKRNPENKHSTFERNFQAFVWLKFTEYEKRQRANHSLAKVKDFRETVVRPLIPELLAGKYKDWRAFGRKLRGAAGPEGDGILSAKQLRRILRQMSGQYKNLPFSI